MNPVEQHLHDLSEIRHLMERSSKFLSLSGFSGICAGLIALAGTYGMYLLSRGYTLFALPRFIQYQIVGVAVLVLVLALGTALYFSSRVARKQNIPFWGPGFKLLLQSILIPLGIGGIFSLILISRGLFYLSFPVTLVFYGISLLNAEKYTIHTISYLGWAEVVLGLTLALLPEYGLLFWGLGFGMGHIIYGTLVHYTYQQ